MSILVTSGADSGPNTLRQAILDAGTTPTTIIIQENLVITLTSPISVNNANLTIEGQAVNGATITGDMNITTDAIFMIDYSTITLRNLVLNKTVQGSYSGINGTNTKFHVENCSLSDFNQDAMYIHATSLNINSSIVDCQVENYGNTGIMIGTANLTNSIDITNTTFSSSLAGDATAFKSAAGSGSLSVINITDCHFTNNKICVSLSGRSTSTISSSTFTNNTVASDQTIYAYFSGSASLTVSDCTFSNNVTTYGVIYINASSAVPITITDCDFHDNSSTNRGIISALKLLSGLTVSKTTFVSNTTNRGCIHFWQTSTSVLTVSESTFTNNQSTRGGAIYTDTGSTATLRINDVMINGNSASDDGGAWYHTSTSGHATIEITDTIINNNRATDTGGGFWANGDITLTLDNSTISNNNASNDGGGMSIQGVVDTLTINNSRFEGNTVGRNGGGIYLYNGWSQLILNSVTATGNHADVGGGFLRTSHNNDASISVTGGSYSNNTADNNGGVFYFSDSDYVLDLSMIGPTFSSNSAINGGCVASYAAKLNSAINGVKFEDHIASAYGGAIFIDANDTVSLNLSNSEFDRNTATYGSAIYFRAVYTTFVANVNWIQDNTTSETGTVYLNLSENGSHNVTMSSTSFINNKANHQGGLFVSTYAPLTFIGDGLTFTSNNANYLDTNYIASAMLVLLRRNVLATVQLLNSSFESNSTTNQVFVSSFENVSDSGTLDVICSNNVYRNNSGTPIKLRQENGSAGSLLIDQCSFQNNTTQVSGGVYAFANANMTVDITNSGFYNNTGGVTGAISVVHNTMPVSNVVTRISNTTVSSNTSDNVGGISFGFQDPDNAEMIITNSTITNNVSPLGGIWRFADNPDSQIILYNTVVTGNTTADITGVVSSDSANNFIGVDTNLVGITNGVNANQIGTAASPLDPELDSLANNGGVTLTRLPTLTSPLRNAGNVTWANNAGLVYDQRGVGYPRIVESNVDIGAVELQERPVCYLGDAIVQVMTLDGDIMNVEAREVVTGQYKVYDILNEEYVPVRANIVTGMTNNLVVIPQDLLGEGLPFDDLYITAGHPLLIDGEYILAKNVKGAKRVVIAPEPIYSIATDESVPILINGLNVYTWAYRKWLKHANDKRIAWKDNIV